MYEKEDVVCPRQTGLLYGHRHSDGTRWEKMFKEIKLQLHVYRTKNMVFPSKVSLGIVDQFTRSNILHRSSRINKWCLSMSMAVKQSHKGRQKSDCNWLGQVTKPSVHQLFKGQHTLHGHAYPYYKDRIWSIVLPSFSCKRTVGYKKASCCPNFTPYPIRQKGRVAPFIRDWKPLLNRWKKPIDKIGLET